MKNNFLCKKNASAKKWARLATGIRKHSCLVPLGALGTALRGPRGPQDHKATMGLTVSYYAAALWALHPVVLTFWVQEPEANIRLGIIILFRYQNSFREVEHWCLEKEAV